MSSSLNDRQKASKAFTYNLVLFQSTALLSIGVGLLSLMLEEPPSYDRLPWLILAIPASALWAYAMAWLMNLPQFRISRPVEGYAAVTASISAFGPLQDTLSVAGVVAYLVSTAVNPDNVLQNIVIVVGALLAFIGLFFCLSLLIRYFGYGEHYVG